MDVERPVGFCCIELLLGKRVLLNPFTLRIGSAEMRRAEDSFVGTKQYSGMPDAVDIALYFVPLCTTESFATRQDGVEVTCQ